MEARPVRRDDAPRPSDWEMRMGFLSKLRRPSDDVEQTCPRCRLPAAAEATECPDCGWDLREGYHPPDAVPEAERT
jgi:hypothetical protein